MDGARVGLRSRAHVGVRWLAVAVLVMSGCGSDAGADEPPGGMVRIERGAVEPSAGIGGSSGRFRMQVEVGMVGGSLLDTTMEGSFDHSTDAFELVIDLRDHLAALPPGAEAPAALGEQMVIRSVDDTVYVHVGAPGRGWVIVPGTLADVLGESQVHHPDRLLALLDRESDGVVAVGGDRVDGADVTRYSGWLKGPSLDEMGASGGALGSIADVAPGELFDRLVRFDVWVDEVGRARRLVVELDLETISEVARRIDGTDDGIDQLRFRHAVDWYDLDVPVAIEAPRPSEVSVIDDSAP